MLPARHDDDDDIANELSAAARIMQSSSKELSTLVADRVLKNINKWLLLLLNKYLKNSLSQRGPLGGREV